MMKSTWQYRRGDIYLADLSQSIGSEQGGIRPVIVLQNNIGNQLGQTLVVATITTKRGKKIYQPTHFCFGRNAAFTRPSMALLEQIRTIDKQRVMKYLGKANRREMIGIEKALRISCGLHPDYCR